MLRNTGNATGLGSGQPRTGTGKGNHIPQGFFVHGSRVGAVLQQLPNRTAAKDISGAGGILDPDIL